MLYKASAPGSLMLLGEFAVLYGKPALVCAIDKRITVTLTPRDDEKIEIHSSALGHYATDIHSITVQQPFHFVLGVLKQLQPKLKRGCNIEITSEFSEKLGLGSSAAVTVALLAAIITWLNIKTQPLDLIRQGRHIIRQIQGVGSGADIAASVYGGIVGFQAQPIAAEKFSMTCPLTALYAGFKTPTVDVIRQVQQHFMTHPALLRQITNGIGQCVIDAMHHLRKEDWSKIGEIMTIQQGMLESLGVSLPLLRNMTDELRQLPGMAGAKISGSGMGDCVIGLGKAAHDFVFQPGQYPEVRNIPVSMTLQGVHCEKI